MRGAKCKIGPNSKCFQENLGNLAVDQSVPEISISGENSLTPHLDKLMQMNAAKRRSKVQTPLSDQTSFEFDECSVAQE